MIIDHCRNIQEFYNLYNSVDNSNLAKPDDILNLNDFCLCFYDEKTNKLRGVIYLEIRKGKIFLSGFSERKNYQNNIDAVIMVCEYLKQDIYSETPFKNAAIILKKCGFKKISENLYKRSKK